MSVFFFPPSLVCRGEWESEKVRKKSGGAHQAGMEESELLCSVENVIRRLHTEHAGVVLVTHFVFVRAESASGPNIERVLEERKRLLKHSIPLETGGRITVLQSSVIDAHDLIGGRNEAGV